MSRDRKLPAKFEETTSSFIEVAIRLGALALLLYWTLILVQPFMSIAIWSAVLTVALYPAFEWLSRQLGGRRRIAAALITLLSLLIVIGPAAWLALGLVDSVRLISERLDLANLTIPPPSTAIKNWPLIGEPIYQFWNLASTNFSAALAQIMPQLKPLGSSLLRIGADTGLGIIMFLASVVVAGFLFSPAPAIADAIKRLSRRLNPTHGEEFVEQAGATIRAVSRGVIGISVLQALLAGIGVTVAGIPQASLITFGVLIFGIIQIGPSIILIPVIIWAWTIMDTLPAFLFTAYIVPVNLLDNLLKPIVMGRGLKTPILVILIGVIGGTLAYGITGLFLGPIVLAVIWELFASWTAEKK
jgi:predicted PurR-regulated permease PerM